MVKGTLCRSWRGPEIPKHLDARVKTALAVCISNFRTGGNSWERLSQVAFALTCFGCILLFYCKLHFSFQAAIWRSQTERTVFFPSQQCVLLMISTFILHELQHCTFHFASSLCFRNFCFVFFHMSFVLLCFDLLSMPYIQEDLEGFLPTPITFVFIFAFGSCIFLREVLVFFEKKETPKPPNTLTLLNCQISLISHC